MFRPSKEFRIFGSVTSSRKSSHQKTNKQTKKQHRLWFITMTDSFLWACGSAVGNRSPDTLEQWSIWIRSEFANATHPRRCSWAAVCLLLRHPQFSNICLSLHSSCCLPSCTRLSSPLLHYIRAIRSHSCQEARDAKVTEIVEWRDAGRGDGVCLVCLL